MTFAGVSNANQQHGRKNMSEIGNQWTGRHIIHDGNTPRGLFTSPADCRKRAHRVKKIHGMLPTLSEMKKRRPDLYNTDICRRCQLEQEDTQHLWRCEMSMEKQLSGWTRAVENINIDGRRAFAKELRQWKDEQRGKGKRSSCGTYSRPRSTE